MYLSVFPPFSRGLRPALVAIVAVLLIAHTVTIPLNSAPQSSRVARIALLHMHDSVSFFKRLGKVTGENKARYAHRHGYDMIYSTPERTTGILRPVPCDNAQSKNIIVSGPDNDGKCWAEDPTFDIDHTRAPTFGKIRLALAACQGRDDAWLFWSDADAMIVNQTLPLESVIDDAYDLIFSYDWLMLNAGMLFVKCSPWAKTFMGRVYDARKFDHARALDQSALQEHLDNLTSTELRAHVKIVPKYAMDVYTEEYRPGDFLLHFAGKLYEATEPGLVAIANQFDILSMVDDVEDIEAFFRGTHLLNYYSGTCDVTRGGNQNECKPEDPRRITLNETLGSMSFPNRYRHVGLRYYWLGNWKDKYDVPGWDKFRLPLVLSSRGNNIDHQHPPIPPSAHHEGAEKPAAPPISHVEKKQVDGAVQKVPVPDKNGPAVDQPGAQNAGEGNVEDGGGGVGAGKEQQHKNDAPEAVHDFDGPDEDASKGNADGNVKGDTKGKVKPEADGNAESNDDPDADVEDDSTPAYVWILACAVLMGIGTMLLIMRRRQKIQSKKQ